MVVWSTFQVLPLGGVPNSARAFRTISGGRTSERAAFNGQMLRISRKYERSSFNGLQMTYAPPSIVLVMAWGYALRCQAYQR